MNIQTNSNEFYELIQAIKNNESLEDLDFSVGTVNIRLTSNREVTIEEVINRENLTRD